MNSKIELNNHCNTCDYTEFIKQYKRDNKNLVYGKSRIRSYEYYDLIQNDTVNIDKVSYIYTLFLYNLKVLVESGVFKINMLAPHDIITATQGVFWNWSNNEEMEECIRSVIDSKGFYFPIFTLPKGVPNNQIDIPENMENLYNTYNGNHRLCVAQYIEAYGAFDGSTWITNVFGQDKLLTIEIPEFCEKSCTGFKYTPLIYDANGPTDPDMAHLLENPVELFHLNRCSEEMKIDISRYFREDWDIPLCRGVDLVRVKDYQFAFRILQEFQNVLEYPLTYYYHINHTLPESILHKMRIVNDYECWKTNTFVNSSGKSDCPLMEFPICIPDSLVRSKCDLSLCCRLCNNRESCSNKCKYI